MRYEKKMLILSGDGKGVVMIERSALGVKYALRTFDVDGDGLRVGIITPTAVFVREIPSGRDPSAVFYTDDTELDALHFAVFGRELVLYGATCKKMWEANVMDVLRRRANIGGEPPLPEPKKLPPLAPTPDKLPLPDGTGLPQSRAAIYGDDALAETDFYTPFELAPRMKQVDSFLDAPRILDGLSPTIEKRLPDPSVPPLAREAAASADGAQADVAQKAETAPERAEDGGPTADDATAKVDKPDSETPATGAAEKAETIETAAAETEVTAVTAADTGNTDGESAEVGETESRAEVGGAETTAVDGTAAETSEKEAAAFAEPDAAPPDEDIEVGAEMPWRMEAAYLSGLSSRPVAQRPPRTVQKVRQRTDARKIREATFFERSRQDVDKLFDTAAADGELAALLPELKWIKVRFDGHSVSVGRGNTVLCYAVAGLYEKASPFGDKAQWLPKLKNAPTGKGYWLIFQNLINGEIVGAV